MSGRERARENSSKKEATFSISKHQTASLMFVQISREHREKYTFAVLTMSLQQMLYVSLIVISLDCYCSSMHLMLVRPMMDCYFHLDNRSYILKLSMVSFLILDALCIFLPVYQIDVLNNLNMADNSPNNLITMLYSHNNNHLLVCCKH